ncbi:Dynein heavy chain 2, axonemal [Nowakowskiella sp. JEL0078]|nr:Dynein heavy chain 2, axonemal [Nowakowskiella sp. JEL0078]
MQDLDLNEYNTINTYSENDLVSRWGQAEIQFLEAFFDKEQPESTQYIIKKNQKIKNTVNTSKVTFNLLPISKRNLSTEKNDDSDSEGEPPVRSEPLRVTRPRTADLTKYQRQTIQNFRELDFMVFTPSSKPTPNPNIYTTGLTEQPRTLSAPRQQRISNPANTIEFFVPHHKRPVSRHTRDLLYSIISDVYSSGFSKSKWSPHRRSRQRAELSNLHCHPAATPMPPCVDALAYHRILGPNNLFGFADSQVKVKLDAIWHEMQSRVLAPTITKKKLDIPRKVSAISHVPDLLHTSEDFEGEFSIASWQLGEFFPLDYFVDSDILEGLVNFLRSSREGVCRVMVPIEETGKSKSNGDLFVWNECEILEHNPSSGLFLVKWKPENLKTFDFSWVSVCNLLGPSSSPNKFDLHLKTAKSLRADFEFNLAVNQCVGMIRPLLEDDFPQFSSLKIEEIFNNIWNSIKNKNNIQNPDILLEKLIIEVKNDYYRSQVKATVTASRTFQKTLSTNKYFSQKEFCLPRILSERTNSDNKLTAHKQLNSLFEIFSPKVMNVLYEWKQKLEELLYSNMYSLIKNKLIPNSLKPGIITQIIPEVTLERKTSILKKGRIGFRREKSNMLMIKPLQIQDQQKHARKTSKISNPLGEQQYVEPFILKKGISVLPDDFTLISLHFKNQFIFFFKNKLEEMVQSVFLEITNAHKITESVPDIRKELSDRLQHVYFHESKKYINTQNEIYLRLGSMLSVFTSSVLQPLNKRFITGLYDLLKEGNLKVRVNLTFCRDEYSKKNIYSDFEFQSVGTAVVKNLLEWIESIKFHLPIGEYTTKPANSRLLQTLFNELIKESIDLAESSVKEYNDIILPKFKNASYKVKLEENYDFFIPSVEKKLSDIQYISNFVIVNTEPVRAGIFDINTENMNNELLDWASETKIFILNSTTHIFNNEIDKLISVCDEFFSLQLPTTFEQAKQAKDYLNYIHNSMNHNYKRICLIKNIKAFLDSNLWKLPDRDAQRHCDALQMHLKLEKFLDERDKQINESMQILRESLSHEIKTFLELWLKIEGSLEKILMDPPGQNSNISVGEEIGFSEMSSSKEDRITVLSKHILKTIEVADALELKIACVENVPEAENLHQINLYMKARNNLIAGLLSFNKNLRNWKTSPVSTLVIEEILNTANEFLESVEISRFLDSRMVKSNKDELTLFLEVEFPLLKILKFPHFRDWHWDRIRNIFGFNFDFTIHSLRFVFDNLNSENLSSVMSRLRDVEEDGKKEGIINNTILEIQQRYSTIKMETEMIEKLHLAIIPSFASALSQIESDLLTIGILSSTAYVENFRGDLENLENTLQTAHNVLKEWEAMQPLIISVTGFFDTEEVRLQLSSESRKYQTIEYAYRTLMVRTTKIIRLSIICESVPELTTQLSEMRIGLQKVIEDVQGWLDNKRIAFPRLFFVADDELLELVSFSKELSTVNKQIHKYFHFKELNCVTDPTDLSNYKIVGIKGNDGELLKFRNPVSTKGQSVEIWLSKLENEMRSSLKDSLVNALNELQTLKNEKREISDNFLFRATKAGYQEYTKQICLLAIQIERTHEIEQAISHDFSALRGFADRSIELIKIYGMSMRQKRGLITKYKALITQEIYFRDWQHELADCKVNSLKNFAFLKGVRYYHDKNDLSVAVRQFNHSTQYGFEYLDCEMSIPWNSALEQCVRIAWTALENKVGIYTFGPPSLGKTEMMKEFAKIVGKYSFAFNCMQVVSMSVLTRLMIGIAMTGSYCIWQFVDRMDPEVFSFFIQGISSLRDLAFKKETFSVSYLGRIVKLNYPVNVGHFTTISPEAFKREEVTGQIRSQMLPVKLFVPNFSNLSSALLCIAGFIYHDTLGIKLGTFFKILPDNLSQQNHYDFSFRMLMIAVRIIEKIREVNPKLDEISLIITGLCVCLIPKLTFEDEKIFQFLLKNIFENEFNFEKNQFNILAGDFEKTNKANQKYANAHELIKPKIREVLDIVKTSRTCLILGKCSTGKSSVIHIAADILDVTLHHLNPISICVENLFGYQDAVGYVNGVFENIIEKISFDKSLNQHWLCIDSPLDTLWTDQLGRALMKDGAICLSTGKRVYIPKNMILIVECTDISSASISFIGHFSLSFFRHEWVWSVQVSEWKSKSRFDSKIISRIEELCSKYIDKIFNFLDESRNKISRSVYFTGFLNLIECMIKEKSKIINSSASVTLLNIIEDVFMFSVIHSFGGAITDEEQMKFEVFFKFNILKNQNSSKLFEFLADIRDTSSTSLFDYNFDVSKEEWNSLEPSLHKFYSPNCEIVKMLLNHNLNSIIVGPLGSRKTSTANNIFINLPENMLGQTISLQPSTEVSFIVSFLNKALIFEQPTNKYIPPNNKSMVIFIDNISHSLPNCNGNRPIWEFMRCLLSYQGYWSNSKIYRKIGNISLLFAGDVLRNGSLNLPDRLLRHLSVLYFPMSKKTIEIFLNNKLHETFNATENGLKVKLHCIIQATIDLFDDLKSQLLVTSKNPLIFFNFSDLAKIFQGISRVHQSIFSDNHSLSKLWIHECNRNFSDRLIGKEYEIFQNCLMHVCKQSFHCEINPSQIFFSDFQFSKNFDLIMNSEPSEQFQSIPFTTESAENFKISTIRGFYHETNEILISEMLQKYANFFKISRKIYLYPNAAIHFIRIDRALGIANNPLIINFLQDDSGLLQDITRCAVMLRGSQIKEIQIAENDDFILWNTMFKGILLDAGLKKIPSVALIQLQCIENVDTSKFWEEIKSLTDGGRVEMSWSVSEFEDILNRMHIQKKKRK